MCDKIKTNEPETTEIQPIISQLPENNVEQIINRADKFVGFLNRLKLIALKATNGHDWSVLGGNPYLTDTGARKIGQVFGVQFKNIRTEREELNDGNGRTDLYFTTYGVAEWNSKSIEEMGTGSTKDKFFAKRTRDGEEFLLPVSEIDIPSVKKKSVTNFYNRAIKRILGLSFEMSDLDAAEIKPASSVNYAGGSRGGNQDTADDKKMRSDLVGMLISICDNNQDAAKKKLTEITAFKAKDGNEVKGISDSKFLKGKRLSITYSKVKKMFEEWEKNVGEDNA